MTDLPAELEGISTEEDGRAGICGLLAHGDAVERLKHRELPKTHATDWPLVGQLTGHFASNYNALCKVISLATMRAPEW